MVENVVNATVQVLVSNVDEIATSQPLPHRRAQAFTTGSNAGGYTLTGIVLKGTFDSSQGNTVTLHEGSVTGAPMYSFTSEVNTDSDLVLTPTAAVPLKATTTYLVVTGNDFGSSVHWLTTLSPSETGETGWTIADGGERVRAGTSTWVPIQELHQLRVEGYPAPALALTSADSKITTRENTSYTFKTADFPFAGANQDDTLASVKIVSLPKMGIAGFGGTLSLDGDAIASGDLPQTVNAADIGKLVFTPVTGQFGDGDVSFTFRVNDGEADSDNTYTMTVDIEPDPDWTVLANNFNVERDSDSVHYRIDSFGASGKTLTQGFQYRARHQLRTACDRNQGHFNVCTYWFTTGPDAGDLRLQRGRYAQGPGVYADHALVFRERSSRSLSDDSLGSPIAWFPAPANATLAGNTNYHVAIQTPSGSITNSLLFSSRLSDGETGLPGWTIENSTRENGVLNSSVGSSVQIGIRGRGSGISFDSGTYTATEGGPDAEVTVVIEPAPSAPVTVPLTLVSRDGGAVAGDHTPIPESLSFAAGQKRQSFTVTATDDDIDDADGESITIALGELPGDYAAGAYTRTTIMLADNDETVSFDAAEYTAAEGDSAGATVTVTLSAAPGAQVAIPLTVTENGLTSAADYNSAGVPASLTFGAAETGKTFTVTAVDDTADDDGESLTLGFGTLPAPYGRGENPEAAVALTDNDAPLAANGEVSTNVNTDYAFSAADFGFDSADGDTLAEVKIVTLPAQGTLTLNGTAIASADLPQTATAAELIAGALVYEPPAGMTGDDFTSFTFRVNDGRSDSVVYTMTIDVTAVTDIEALVSNIRQARSGRSLDATSFGLAQGFTTGEHDGGYVLTSVEIDFDNTPDHQDGLTVVVERQGSNPNRPGSAVATLDTPSNVTSGAGVKTFNDPMNTVLDPNTNYFVLLHYNGGDSFNINNTTSPGEDMGSANDWEILDESIWSLAGSWFDHDNTNPLKIRVNGYPVVLPDIEVNFGARSYTATEGGSAAAVEVTLSRAPGEEVEIPLSVVGYNWGAEALDHSPIRSPLTFGAEDTRRTFLLTATDDTANDDGESVTIGLGDLPEDYVKGRTDQTTVSLVDNEGVLVSNLGQTMADRSNESIGNEDHEMQFRTGPNPGGYELTSIEIVLTTTSDSNIDLPCRLAPIGRHSMH